MCFGELAAFFLGSCLVGGGVDGEWGEGGDILQSRGGFMLFCQVGGSGNHSTLCFSRLLVIFFVLCFQLHLFSYIFSAGLWVVA